jgi:hypothetical protein
MKDATKQSKAQRVSVSSSGRDETRATMRIAPCNGRRAPFDELLASESLLVLLPAADACAFFPSMRCGLQKVVALAFHRRLFVLA